MPGFQLPAPLTQDQSYLVENWILGDTGRISGIYQTPKTIQCVMDSSTLVLFQASSKTAGRSGGGTAAEWSLTAPPLFTRFCIRCNPTALPKCPFCVVSLFDDLLTPLSVGDCWGTSVAGTGLLAVRWRHKMPPLPTPNPSPPLEKGWNNGWNDPPNPLRHQEIGNPRNLYARPFLHHDGGEDRGVAQKARRQGGAW